MNNNISAVKLSELEVFIEVSRAKSIREVARRLKLSPSKVSKIIIALEAKLGTKVYKRSVMGVLPTGEGSELLKIAADIVKGSNQIKALLAGQGKHEFRKSLAVASSSFLNIYLTTPVISSLEKTSNNGISYRFLDLAPNQLVPVALRGGFEIALHYGQIAWPTTWSTKKIGNSKWVLVCRNLHPLPKRPKLKNILDYPFVFPVYWTQEGLTRGDDQFPIPISKRKLGYETASADAAVPIVLRTNQIAFLPNILVNELLHSNLLRVIESSECKDIEQDIYLSVRSDIVSSSVFKNLADNLSQRLSVLNN